MNRFNQVFQKSTKNTTREDFLDFQLSPANLPSLRMHKAADHTEKPRVGVFWSSVELIKTLDGNTRFKTLCKLVYGLMSIHCSNADSERGFSMLRKIHTDQRSNLGQSTVTALMTLTFNCDDCCHDIDMNSDLLSQFAILDQARARSYVLDM